MQIQHMYTVGYTPHNVMQSTKQRTSIDIQFRRTTLKATDTERRND